MLGNRIWRWRRSDLVTATTAAQCRPHLSSVYGCAPVDRREERRGRMVHVGEVVQSPQRSRVGVQGGQRVTGDGRGYQRSGPSSYQAVKVVGKVVDRVRIDSDRKPICGERGNRREGELKASLVRSTLQVVGVPVDRGWRTTASANAAAEMEMGRISVLID